MFVSDLTVGAERYRVKMQVYGICVLLHFITLHSELEIICFFHTETNLVNELLIKNNRKD